MITTIYLYLTVTQRCKIIQANKVGNQSWHKWLVWLWDTTNHKTKSFYMFIQNFRFVEENLVEQRIKKYICKEVHRYTEERKSDLATAHWMTAQVRFKPGPWLASDVIARDSGEKDAVVGCLRCNWYVKQNENQISCSGHFVSLRHRKQSHFCGVATLGSGQGGGALTGTQWSALKMPLGMGEGRPGDSSPVNWLLQLYCHYKIRGNEMHFASNQKLYGKYILHWKIWDAWVQGGVSGWVGVG